MNACPTITFLGAAETVTGSRFYLEGKRSNVLVDCGLFQGIKRLRRMNWEPFPVPPSDIDAVLITHAHIDHSGFLPALVRDGYDGPIWCTPGTAALLRLMLLDSAHLQEEEARFANKHRTSRHSPAKPLYTTLDAERALEHLRTIDYNATETEVADDCTATFTNVGHIIGSAAIKVTIDDVSITFTGDVGRPNDPVMTPPVQLAPSDFLVTESTYGNRLHSDANPEEELREIVKRTTRRGGTVLIPSFAVGRAQSILHLLVRLRHEGRIPDIPIYLNSPMSIRATDILMEFPDQHRLDSKEVARVRDGVRYMHTVDESKMLSTLHGPMIIVSASGMATGGRILHHLIELAPDHRNTIVFAGFQAAGTRGEHLVNGARKVKIFGNYVPVRADVELLTGLSAHADHNELIDWLQASKMQPHKTFVVHGEPSAADAMRRELADRLGFDAVVPSHLERIALEKPAPETE